MVNTIKRLVTTAAIGGLVAIFASGCAVTATPLDTATNSTSDLATEPWKIMYPKA